MKAWIRMGGALMFGVICLAWAGCALSTAAAGASRLSAPGVHAWRYATLVYRTGDNPSVDFDEGDQQTSAKTLAEFQQLRTGRKGAANQVSVENALGAEGWECIGRDRVSSPEGTTVWLYFKMPYTATTEVGVSPKK